MNTHLRTHSDKKFHISEAQIKFFIKNYLNEHILIHTYQIQ